MLYLIFITIKLKHVAVKMNLTILHEYLFVPHTTENQMSLSFLLWIDNFLRTKLLQRFVSEDTKLQIIHYNLDIYISQNVSCTSM